MSELHYDPDSNTAHFDVQRGNEHIRVVPASRRASPPP
jgi:hypothetical protein